MKQDLFNRLTPARWLLPAALGLLLGLQACSKDKLCEDEPFCARVNGKLWWPSDNGDFKARPLTISLLYGDSVLAIRASNGSERIYLSVRDGKVISAKDYTLTDTLSRGYFDKSLSSDEFETDSVNTGLLSITEINCSKKTLTGTFFFKAFNSATGEVVEVSNGRFDAFYTEY
ncbi:DUF6252 family protein [Pontibacter russatus]|uniref:DUF6252 family protein n=1 Tax=Pontibacter russatus TaxID=2694929 RepID=UPI00137A07AE|nr:DUF6252 family protein [Pontibacter russatus]